MQGVPSTGPEGQTLHFLDYWRIIRIRKLFILAVFLLVLGSTAIFTYWRPKQYASTVRMEVEKDGSDVANVMGQKVFRGYDPYFLQTQFEIIQSKEILYPVISELNLAERWSKRYGVNELQANELLQLLSNRMRVRNVRNTTLIEIQVTSEEPQEAAEIANKIAETYKRIRMDQILRTSSGGIEKFREELAEQDKKVKEKQVEVDRLRKEFDISDVIAEGGASQTLEPETLRRYEAMRIESQDLLSQNSTKLEKLKELKRPELRKAIQSVQYDEQLALLLKQVNDLEQQLDTLLKEVSEDHPDAIKKSSSLKVLNRQIDERVDGIMQGLAINVAAYKAKYEEFTKAVEQAKASDIAAANKNRPYFVAKRDLESLQRYREALIMRINQESVEAKLPRSIVEIKDPAEAELKPVSPKMMVNLVIGAVFGVLLGIGLAFFIEYLDTSVKTIDDIERLLEAPVLGVIPQSVGLLYKEGADTAYAEAYRVLRTNLLFARKNPEGNTLTIVSAGAGEGKSTTILNLATVFAQNGQRVLLVDSDLRRPSLHKLLGVSNQIGLTSVLMKQNTLEQVLVKTPLENLDFLPSGKLPSSAIGILSSPPMKQFIQDIRKHYDFVFFDAPPILGVSDASILVSEVDAAILVVQYRKYPQAMTVRAKQMVSKVSANLLGIVLNNINMSQDSDYYYGGYSYTHYGLSDEARTDEDKALDKGGKAAVKQKY